MQTLTLAQARKITEAALRADTPIHWIGDPGIGKTAIVSKMAADMGVDLAYLSLTQCDPSDTGGIPVPVLDANGNRTGQVLRFPIGPIRMASEKPVVLFLDEMSQAGASQQGAALGMVQERRAGDITLHPDTRIVLASNGSDTSGSGQELIPPMLNRMTHITVSPSLDEVQGYLFTLGKDGSTLRALATDYAMTLAHSPGLLQTFAPKGVAASGRPWASPRAIERAIRLCAMLIEAGEGDGTDGRDATLFFAGLSGNLSEEVAGAYMAIRKVRDQLASKDEILADPKNARLPASTDAGIASLGVLGHVALVDAGAAWIYAERLSAEIRVAAGRALMRFPTNASKYKSDADRARVKMLGSIGSVLVGV